jgi:enoyl-CoA hydratase/carnithine racemase
VSILFEKKDKVAYITINRPEVMNSLNVETMNELGQVWAEFRDDDGLWVAIITGAGDMAFCAGADLRELIPEITSGRLKISPTITSNFPIALPAAVCYVKRKYNTVGYV